MYSQIRTLVFAIIAFFIAGLMVGRTPECLGKQIEAFEMKMASLVILIPCVVVLFFTALAVATPWGRGARYDPDSSYTSISNPGARGLSEGQVRRLVAQYTEGAGRGCSASRASMCRG